MFSRLLRFCFSADLLLLLPPCDNAVPACSSATTSQLVVPVNSRRCFLGQQPSAVLVRRECIQDRRVCLWFTANNLSGNMASA
eukprot:16438852-Heterocapsa_arctica.AAC.1